MFYVGIDWAKDFHQIHITDDSGAPLSIFKVFNNYEGLNKLLGILQKLPAAKTDIFIGIETNIGILTEFLLNNEYVLYALNPSVVDSCRSRYKVSRAKTDPIDAMVIANILRTDRHNYRPLRPDSPLCRKIRIISRDRKNLTEEKTRIELQLQESLKIYYPVALELFSGTSVRVFIDFVKLNPSLEEARKFPVIELENLLRRHRISPLRASTINDKINAAHIDIPSFIVEAKKKHVLSLLSLLELLLDQLKDYDKEIAALIALHPYHKSLISLPGVSFNLCSRILSEIGDNLSQFKNYNSLQSYAGTAPVSFFSGISRKSVRRRKACNKYLRDALHLMAFSSINCSSWAKQYYLYLKHKGKGHNQALRNLANKWVKIIFAMLSTNSTYNENYHINNMKKHLSGEPILINLT